MHFPNLDGLRFIAAFAVLVYHSEQVKLWIHVPNLYENASIALLGPLGVVLFFVLSGFLITYLLLEEERAAGSISIRNFYVRRILRIWPLYYALVILAMFVLPRTSLAGAVWQVRAHPALRLFLMTAFMPNVAFRLLPQLPYANQTWSIGVEEQYYLVWPWAIRSAKNRLRFIITILILWIGVRLVAEIALRTVPGQLHDVMALVVPILRDFSAEALLIGALFAVILFESRSAILAALTDVRSQIICYVLIAAAIATGFHLPWSAHVPLYSVLFAAVILNLASNPRSLLRLNARPLAYLGKISYGIYMYQYIGIMIAAKAIRTRAILAIPGVVTVSGLVVTVAISSLSYHAFEAPMLKLKRRFARVVTDRLEEMAPTGGAPA